MNEPAPQVISILGSTVHYWTYHPDKSTAIVALHGFRGTHHGLQKIIDNLPGFRIIVPDLPGFGDSTPMNERPHDITGYRDFAQQFIATVLPNQSVILLGHSFGTTIAADLAAHAPGLIKKLICINPIATKNTNMFNPALAIGRFYYWFGGKVLGEFLGLRLLKSSSVILLGSILMVKTKDKELRKEIHYNHIKHFGSFQNRTVLNESYDASISHAIRDYATYITMPTLLIAGASDDIAPAKGQYLLRKILPDVQLVMIPKVGHLIHYETPKQAAKAISQFLK